MEQLAVSASTLSKVVTPPHLSQEVIPKSNITIEGIKTTQRGSLANRFRVIDSKQTMQAQVDAAYEEKQTQDTFVDNTIDNQEKATASLLNFISDEDLVKLQAVTK